MCGIVGMLSEEKFLSSDILKSLKRLEYRGYDSFGYATDTGIVEKRIGDITFERMCHECSVAIAHTRWATHGNVTKDNAHPHADCTNSLFVVHNGIIENYHEFKSALEKLGHKFRSQTDTEIIAHFFEEELKKGKPIQEAIKDFFSVAKGTFAVLLLRKGDDKIYALKRDSPLVLGIADSGFILASDIYAFSDRTNKAIFFEDNEYAVIGRSGYAFHNSSGEPVEKQVKEFYWQRQDTKHDYEHHMLNEIMEEPAAAERLLESLEGGQKDKLQKMADMIKKSEKVLFVATGTSYHASLVGCYLMHKLGINAQTLIASEFKNYILPGRKTLVIAMSQSGETMDVIDALKMAKRNSSVIASFVNVPHSTIQRMSDIYIEILAGQEICVAATKSFVNQCVLLMKICSLLGLENDIARIPSEIKEILKKQEKIKELATSLKDNRDIYLIGRGIAYPVAREIALKLKEISYIHAEGMMGGELKHGTLALIEEGTPVISLIPKGNHDIISNTKEVEARGGRIIALSNGDTEFSEHIKISTEHEDSFALLSAIVGQLLTYYIARERGLPIDKPRNLAKTITVK